MATNFFERQDAARRNTKWLVVMFVLAVIGLVGTTILATVIALGAMQGGDSPAEIPFELALAAGVGTLALIGGGSLYKIAQLSSGGTVVAERLGGCRLYPNTADLAERRVLNVVEEMALASGVPVPPVFLLTEEKGINAFAAGFSPGDAVIGVTRGTADQLTRDQLQGVMAHEFSHILNGDMRLNLRLIGVLHGILLVGIVGRELLRIASRGGGRRRGKGNGGLYLLLLGLAFMVIGFLGALFGNLIKAAVSRQREFLADASAVQFTRNPEGIAGALKRIGSAVFGSRVENPRAAEASHMYFAAGLSGMFATHPPLEERIRLLDPQWDGTYPPPLTSDAVAGLDEEQVAGLVGAVGDGEPRKKRRVRPQDAGKVAAMVGNPTETHRRYAQQLIAAMPTRVVEAAHEPYGARAVIFALLLDRDAQMRGRQLRALESCVDQATYRSTHHLIPWIDELDVQARLPLVDMALPALRAMSLPQYQEFAQCFETLVQADEKIALFEWTLHQVLLRHLRSQFEPPRPRAVRYYGLQRLDQPCSVLLSALARAGACDDAQAFDAAARQLPEVPVRLLPPEESGLNQLQDALSELTQVAPKQRAQLVNACAAAICADAAVEVAEVELLRAVCDMLDCPLPPLLPGQSIDAPAEAARETSQSL